MPSIAAPETSSWRPNWLTPSRVRDCLLVGFVGSFAFDLIACPAYFNSQCPSLADRDVQHLSRCDSFSGTATALAPIIGMVTTTALLSACWMMSGSKSQRELKTPVVHDV